METQSSATRGPTRVRSSSRGSVWYTTTSGRREANRWSSTMYSRVIPVAMSGVKGTGLAGSLTHSSKASSAPGWGVEGKPPSGLRDRAPSLRPLPAASPAKVRHRFASRLEDVGLRKAHLPLVLQEVVEEDRLDVLLVEGARFRTRSARIPGNPLRPGPIHRAATDP